MTTSYIVERIDYKPGMSTDTDGEAVCLEEHDDRTWNKREFATEEAARDYIVAIRGKTGKWLASIKLLRVSSEELPIDLAPLPNPCDRCDGDGWDDGELCNYCDTGCSCLFKPYDNSECRVHSIHERVSGR